MYRKNNWLLIISVCICIGVASGLVYSMNKVANLQLPQNYDTKESSSEAVSGSVYDKYIQNQEEIDKQNGNIDYNTKRSADSINAIIYNLNDFLFDCYQNLKAEEIIATTKSGKDVYALLNYDTVDELKLKLKDYVIDDNNVLTEVLNGFGFYIVKDKVGTLNEISTEVYWVNKNYYNNIIFSNETSAEVEVPLYQTGTVPISAPVQQLQLKPLTDSYGNTLGGENNSSNTQVDSTAKYNYPGKTMNVKLIKDHGNWKISKIVFND